MNHYIAKMEETLNQKQNAKYQFQILKDKLYSGNLNNSKFQSLSIETKFPYSNCIINFSFLIITDFQENIKKQELRFQTQFIQHIELRRRWPENQGIHADRAALKPDCATTVARFVPTLLKPNHSLHMSLRPLAARRH